MKKLRPRRRKEFVYCHPVSWQRNEAKSEISCPYVSVSCPLLVFFTDRGHHFQDFAGVLCCEHVGISQPLLPRG